MVELMSLVVAELAVELVVVLVAWWGVVQLLQLAQFV